MSSEISSVFRSYGSAIRFVARECPRGESGIEHCSPNGNFRHALNIHGHVICLDRRYDCPELEELYPYPSIGQIALDAIRTRLC